MPIPNWEAIIMGQGMAKRIHDLRISQKMTLEDVASIVGVGKSTVRKWETGMIANMRRDKIAGLAKALNTTPAYLMGWEEEEKKEALTEKDLSESEQKLIELFRKVPEDRQDFVMKMIEAAIESL
jgi:transcriptional regulator with XRE-family HTH domain